MLEYIHRGGVLGTRQEIGLVVLLLVLAILGNVPDLFSTPVADGKPCRIGMEIADDVARAGNELPISGSHSLLAGVPIDLNTARAVDLEALPGIGPVLAQRIVALRDERGGFSNLDELRAVKGIGAKRLKTLRRYLTISTKILSTNGAH